MCMVPAMSATTDFAPRTYIASDWQRAWTYRWSKSAPSGAEFSNLKVQMNAFFLHAVTYANWETGENWKTPPSFETLASGIGCSAQRVSLLYETAEALGIMRLRRGPSGKRILGYALQTPLGDVLAWGHALHVLKGDRRARARAAEKETTSAAAVPRETVSADTVQDSVLSNYVRGCSSDEQPEHGTTSADTQNYVRGHSELRPRRGRPSTETNSSPAMADLSGPQQAPAREAVQQDGIQEVEEQIVPVRVTRRAWSVEKQARMVARFRMRPDDEIVNLMLTMRGDQLSERERARYLELQAREYAPWDQQEPTRSREGAH